MSLGLRYKLLGETPLHYNRTNFLLIENIVFKVIKFHVVKTLNDVIQIVELTFNIKIS